ncbi:MAG: hypothetical protein AABY83_02230 [Pseudomonadota bacterium]
MDNRTPLEKIPLPFNKEISFEEIVYDNGFRMLRMTIREGRRFTTLELDEMSATRWRNAMSAWLTPEKEHKS